MLKLCQSCLFRAQDEAVICRTCGGANLIKLEVTHADSSMQDKAQTYFRQLKDAKDEAVTWALPAAQKLFADCKPHVVAAGRRLASALVELKHRLLNSANAINKMRATLPAPAPLEKPRPRLVSAEPAGGRSLPVLLRAKPVASAPSLVEEADISDRSLPVLLRNMNSKKR